MKGKRTTRWRLGLLVVMATLLTLRRLGADEVVSYQAFPLDRYKVLFERFPFGKEQPAQAAPAPVEQKAGFADDLQMTGHFKIGSILYVNLLNRRTQERIVANSQEGNSDKIKVMSLSTDDDPYNVKALLQWHGESASLGFDRPAPARATQPGSAPANLQIPNGPPPH